MRNVAGNNGKSAIFAPTGLSGNSAQGDGVLQSDVAEAACQGQASAHLRKCAAARRGMAICQDRQAFNRCILISAPQLSGANSVGDRLKYPQVLHVSAVLRCGASPQ